MQNYRNPCPCEVNHPTKKNTQTHKVPTGIWVVRWHICVLRKARLVVGKSSRRSMPRSGSQGVFTRSLGKEGQIREPPPCGRTSSRKEDRRRRVALVFSTCVTQSKSLNSSLIVSSLASSVISLFPYAPTVCEKGLRAENMSKFLLAPAFTDSKFIQVSFWNECGMTAAQNLSQP